MHTVLRNLLTTTVVILFSLSVTAATNTDKDSPSPTVKKQVQDARTLDGKKPEACNFKISLS